MLFFMTNRASQFPPIFDRLRFPLLTTLAESPCRHLIGCTGLTFFAPKNIESVPRIILNEPQQWQQYGDTRWPSLSSWIEIETGAAGYHGYSGVLIVTYQIPSSKTDAFQWIARNGPLHDLFPEERSDDSIVRRIQSLRQQALQANDPCDPPDSSPHFVQSYCIYRGPQDTQLIATYTDLLNRDGVTIPRYRMANVETSQIETCRFTLHALFRLNEARLTGEPFLAQPQLKTFEAIILDHAENDAPWVRFHPLRVLRARPAVRALPTPNNLVEGIMPMEAYKFVLETRRMELNLHQLAFEREVRPRTTLNDDTNATMGAFVHRANGGAIYLLPDALVEEFDNTDCDEVRMSDIRLPFTNVFIKFTPSTPLALADGALVDGCYVVLQGDEYLFSMTSRLNGVDYNRSLSITCVDPTFAIHLPLSASSGMGVNCETGLPVNEAVELGIKDFLEKNAPPIDNQSQVITRPDGTKAFIEDIRAQSRKRRIELFRTQEPVFRACLNIIVNAICFISFRPNDITEDWDGEPPKWVIDALEDPRNTRSARDRRQQALRVMATGDFTRIRICGKDLFQQREAVPLTGHGVSPRAHWRRGHWRRQRHGVGLSLVTPRWIRPTVVKKDNGTPVETRLYDVHSDAKPSKSESSSPNEN